MNGLFIKIRAQNAPIDRCRTVRAALAVLLLVAFFSTGCREKKRVAQASRNLAAKLSHTSEAAPDPPKSVDIAEQRVYLDATLSMKGFVNEKKHSAFDDFIEQVGDALPGCKLYKYGQAGSQPPQSSSELIQATTFGLELHQPAFYNLAYNPDDRLIEDLANEDKPVLSILISDGVYSEPRGSTAPPVVDAIRAWISRGRVFGILILKSSFKGPFYSERLRSWLPPVSVSSRPFYAFVFSPSDRAFKEVQEKLQRRFPSMQSLLFSDDAASCSVNVDEHFRALYSFAKPPSASYYWQMFNSDLFSQKVPVEIGYYLKYVVSPEYPANEFKTDVSPEFYRWEKADFRKVEVATPGFSLRVGKTAETSISEANKQSKPVVAPPDFVVYFPKDASTDYEFYSFKVISWPKSIRQDIQDLSTRDDGMRENADKTFRFFELISAVTDVHFKARLAQRTSPQIFVTVANH
jgi:hypothetical protein